MLCEDIIIAIQDLETPLFAREANDLITELETAVTTTKKFQSIAGEVSMKLDNVESLDVQEMMKKLHITIISAFNMIRKNLTEKINEAKESGIIKESQLTPVNNKFQTIVESLEYYKTLVKNKTPIMYISFAITPVIVVLLLIMMGLICAGIAYYGHMKPADRICVTQCARRTLLIASASMFGFSCLLMILCVIQFTMGFAIHLGCSSTFNDPQMKLHISLQEQWPLDAMFKFVDYNMPSIKNIYESCANDETLYASLQLRNMISTRINHQFLSLYPKNIKIDIKLEKYNDFLNALPNFSDNEFANNLESFSMQSTSDKLEQAKSNLLTIMEQAASAAAGAAEIYEKLAGIKQDLEKLIDLTSKTIIQKNNILEAFNYTQNSWRAAMESLKDTKLANEMKLIRQNLSNTVYDVIRYNALAFQQNLQSKLVKCRPLVTIWNGFGDILCKRVAYPLEGIWLGLGWCVILFIPLILLSILISEYMDVMVYHPVQNQK